MDNGTEDSGKITAQMKTQVGVAAEPENRELSNSQIPHYEIVKKGVALIFVNSFNDIELGRVRRVSEAKADFDAMDTLWKQVGCEVRPYTDLSAEEMEKTIKDFANSSNEGYDYVVVVISTHGGVYAESVIKQRKSQKYMSATRKKNYDSLEKSQTKAKNNGEDSTTEVFMGDDYVPVRERDVKEHFFNTARNRSLLGKPKFFIFNYCRGIKADFGIKSCDARFRTDTEKRKVPVHLPSVSDMIVAYATHPDFVAWQHMSDGSWLISTIADVFSENYRDVDVATMLTIVNKVIKEKVANVELAEQRRVLEYKAMSVFESSLDKLFYLNGPPSVLSNRMYSSGQKCTQKPLL